MGWFGITTKKDPKEAAYEGGKKNFKEVIENEAPGELLYSIDPRENFNTGSTLIVHPGEVALFETNGNISEEFENGRYELSTENYAFLSRVRNMFTGGASSFNCRIHFFRDADSSEIKWGTQSPLIVEDNIYNEEAKLGVAATYKIKIDNPTKCLKKLLGNNVYFKSQEDMNSYWSGEFSSIIREITHNALKEYPKSLYDVLDQTMTISNLLREPIENVMSDYGIKLVKFSIVNINILDDFVERVRANKDIVRKAQLGAQAKVATAQGDQAMFDVLGSNWDRMQRVEIMKEIAKNPSSGMAGLGAELGMGMATMGAFAGMTNQVINQQMGTAPQTAGSTPPPVQKAQYYLYINNQQMGPYDIQSLGLFVQGGQLTPQTLVWKEGLTEWVQAGTTELQQLFTQAGPTPPKPPTPPTPPTNSTIKMN